MSIVSIKVNGRDYQVACDNGEEDRLRQLAEEVDERIQSLNFSMKNKPNEAMAMLLVSLMMVDELAEKQKEIEKITQESKRAIAKASVKTDNSAAAKRMEDMELAMAATMDEIANRIEKIADQIEA